MQRLQQILAFANVAAGATAQAQVLLNINQGLAVIPDVLAFDNSDFEFVSLVGTTLTVRNDGSASASSNAWLIYFHTIERSYGAVQTTQLTPAPFVIRGAGGHPEIVGKMNNENAQPVANAGSLVVAWDVSEYSVPAGLVDLANDRFVIPIDGTYLITAMLTWEAAAATGQSRVVVRVNGGGSPTAQQIIEWSGGLVARSQVASTTMQLNAGDLVTLFVDQTTAAERDVFFAEYTISRVGP
jgi:hypothetical protein